MLAVVDPLKPNQIINILDCVVRINKTIGKTVDKRFYTNY